MTRLLMFLAVFGAFALAVLVGVYGVAGEYQSGTSHWIAAGLLMVAGGVAWIITDEVYIR